MKDREKGTISVPRSLVEKLALLGTPTIYEALGKRGAMDFEIKPLKEDMKVCGSAFTVKCHVGDNLTIHYALSIAERGVVLVVDAGGYKEAGAWGEIATVAAMARGIKGLVIDGAVRDSEAVCGYGFPLFARAISMKGTAKKTLGDVNTQIMCGGVLIRPGDIIIGDRDGVVAVPLDKVKQVYEKGRKREQHEKEIMKRLREGELTIDILDFRKIVEKEIQSR